MVFCEDGLVSEEMVINGAPIGHTWGTNIAQCPITGAFAGALTSTLWFAWGSTWGINGALNETLMRNQMEHFSMSKRNATEPKGNLRLL